MRYILIFVFIISNCLANDGTWVYEDGWVFKAKREDASAGGAIIQKKVTDKKENKYHTINGERYITTDEWKKIIGNENETKQNNIIPAIIMPCPMQIMGFPKGPEPTSGGLFQLGLVVAFYARRFFSRYDNN